MGIIKATVTAVRGAAADQWKEAFCAGEMGADLLMARAKKLTGQNSTNDGIGEVITDGSTILVAIASGIVFPYWLSASLPDHFPEHPGHRYRLPKQLLLFFAFRPKLAQDLPF